MPDYAPLLVVARQALTAFTRQQPFSVDLEGQPAEFVEKRACFVSLFVRPSGDLRGCTGTLAARQPLIEEVIHTTRQTAFSDSRFAPVGAAEVPQLQIEISVLTPPLPLPYADAGDLLRQLRPQIDGVVLEYQGRRATFLPDVWQRLSHPADFLSALCRKMGVAELAWRDHPLHVSIYQTLVVIEA